MRRRELQSFNLKLSDLKQYEAIRLERMENKSKKSQEGCSATLTPIRQPPIVKYGPKSKHEIEKRIGMDT